ncbi:hypothetical protein QYE76_051848 [Lolium multiflorum]|uniref:Integrase catalytic domain-containing protein n=1 Tax=Lolium multiflorum TaxID=4521 RepID=A0AAD8STT7_LOLMU|nr:hypothetical protein QYE76_051848 [Lolium multiflorum]
MVGKLHKAWPGGYVYLLVAVDKFTKWIETVPVTSADAASVVSFIKGIVFRFGVPNSIVIDNGINFTSKEFKAYYAEVGIKLHFASVAHPQTDASQINPTKEIFSELDEINAQGPIFPRSFRKTEGITKWGEEVPTPQGRAAWVGPAPPYIVGPRAASLTYPSAYLKPLSRIPPYREPRYGKPSDTAAANPISGI